MRVWASNGGECKFTLTAHEHVVEDVAVAPASARPAINALVFGDEVRSTHAHTVPLSLTVFLTHAHATRHMQPPAHS